MLRISFLILSVLVFNNQSHSQAEAVVEQYHFAGKGTPYLFMPVAHFRTARNWYVEARYNYEDIKTFSLHLGKSFTGDKGLSYSLTPLLGASIGSYKGISTGLNVDLEFEQFFFSAQSQYSMATARGKGSDDFFYSWSEAGYQPLDWLYAGASLQHTMTSYEKMLEPGMLLGFSFNRFSIPLYCFDLFNNKRYFIIGLTVSWQGKKKEGSNQQTKPVKF